MKKPALTLQARPWLIMGIFLVGAALALATGLGAGKVYRDRAPAASQGLSLDGLPPLPAWAAEPLPDFSGFSNAEQRKDAFLDYLFPRIALANQRLLTLRQRVAALAAKQSLTPAEETFLARQAERLQAAAPPGSAELFEALKRRLDMIPPSLALAQAANESAWGTSRFARQGNNLFGQWCFSPGCGLVPLERTAGARHEVARFESPYQSVSSYLTNLNRHPGYRQLRASRAELRAGNQLLTGPALAAGLRAYSARGNDYSDEIVSIIRFNNLQRYDHRFGKWLENRTLSKKVLSEEEWVMEKGGST